MTAKEQLERIFSAALQAVQPGEALLRHVSLVGDTLKAGGREYKLEKGRIIVAGAGKGAAPMGRAAEDLLGERIAKGLLVVKHGHGLPLGKIKIAEAAHPVPDAQGEAAAAELLELAGEAGPDDLLLCLFTGGASSLLPAPAKGLTLEDLQKTTATLLASGASINELNTIRKHLSRISGGQLARAAHGANVLALIVSDVVGDDLSAIASGPTAPDAGTFAEALGIIEKYRLADSLPASVLAHLRAGADGEISETPKPEDPLFKKVSNIIIASNEQALQAAASEAEKLGLQPRIIRPELGGEAKEVAAELVQLAKETAATLAKGEKPVCLLAGGETTVTIRGSGLGGRNQEMALAAAILLADQKRISCLFAGTDGTDGPTDAAGGFAFYDTAGKMGGKSGEFLENNDSYHALKMADELFVTGPTRTNVMDIAIIIVNPPE